jgi:hypothetical protein
MRRTSRISRWSSRTTGRAGLGALLLGMLADSAAAQGIRRLSGDVLADNEAMCRLLKRSGWRQSRDRFDARLVVAQMDLGQPAGLQPTALAARPVRPAYLSGSAQ